jgi:hypothetical protein
MDEKRFWDIIAIGCPKTLGASWIDALGFQLRRLGVEEIDSFALVLDSKLRAACTFDLRAVGLMLDRNDEVDFFYFCNWLVGMGKPIYESALVNPDSLADLIQEGEDFRADLTYITRLAWAQVTGQPPRLFQQGKDLLSGGSLVDHMAGEPWDLEDVFELRRRFPRLAARFLAPEEGIE